MPPADPLGVAMPTGQPVVVSAFTRGVDIFRPLAILYSAAVAWSHRDEMAHPAVAAAGLAVLMGWSLAIMGRRHRTLTVVAAEVTLACLGVLATSLVYPADAIVGGVPTLPGVWAAAGVVAAAIVAGARAGVIAAVVIGVVDVVEVTRPNAATVHNIVLLLLLGSLVGLAVTLARQSQERLEAAVALQERYAERERLSRVVHDGVLQTLSMITRRGHEIGGEATHLAELASHQETSLRRFVGQNPVLVDGGAAGVTASVVDLAVVLGDVAGPEVSVSSPADPVPMEAARAEQVRASVAAALDNVARHAGDGVRVWILLEDLEDRVLVTVRDDGHGMEPARLAEAAADGRLGIASSIRGRIEDLGGRAVITSRPGAGCTVALEVPRRIDRTPGSGRGLAHLVAALRSRSHVPRAAGAWFGAGPESAGPETAGPETAGPETAGPETAGPETAGPETAGSSGSGVRS